MTGAAGPRDELHSSPDLLRVATYHAFSNFYDISDVWDGDNNTEDLWAREVKAPSDFPGGIYS